MRVPAGTTAGFRLREDILYRIHMMQEALMPRCHYQITDTKMTGQEGPTILEEWVVEACGERVKYLIKLTPSPQGGTVISVLRL